MIVQDAHRPPDELAPATAEFGKTVLENGVRVITEAMDGVRSVSIGVMVDCGSKDEKADQAGLAHLCEHLLFQGTSARDALEIARQVDGFGQVGGLTTRDYTCYFAATLDDYQFHALDLLGDVLLNPTFPADCVLREKRAVLAEIERSWDVPERYVHDLAKRRAWHGSALGRSIAGTADSIAQHTRENIIYFLQRHYTPERIIIAAAGHVGHEDFVAQTRDAFWRLLGPGDDPGLDTPQFHPGLTVECANSAQVYFCLVIPAPPYADAGRYLVHVLNRILGGGISSRLSRKLREDTGLVYEVSSEYHAYRAAGMISVEGSTSPDHLVEVTSAVLATMADLFAGVEPIDAEELWRAKTHIRIQHLTSSEDAHTRMCRLATQEMYFGRRLEASKVLAQIDAVELNRVSAFARDHVFRQLSKAHLVVVGPVRHESATRARLSDLLSQFRPNSTTRKRPARNWSDAMPRGKQEELIDAQMQPTNIERT